MSSCTVKIIFFPSFTCHLSLYPLLRLSIVVCLCVCVCAGVMYGMTAGEYLPWERELQSGLWLESLANEEDTGIFKGSDACGCVWL